MSDAPDNLVIELLRAIRSDISQLRESVADQGRRLTLLEIAVSNLAASEMGHYANFSLRADRIEMRLDRIEKRLGLIEA
jgi:hypothetical protein